MEILLDRPLGPRPRRWVADALGRSYATAAVEVTDEAVRADLREEVAPAGFRREVDRQVFQGLQARVREIARRQAAVEERLACAAR